MKPFDDPALSPTATPALTDAQRLAAAIRRGKPLVSREDRGTYRLCALGCAFAGLHGREMTKDEHHSILRGERSVESAMADLLGVPERLTRSVSALHYGGLPALEIAARLERGELT